MTILDSDIERQMLRLPALDSSAPKTGAEESGYLQTDRLPESRACRLCRWAVATSCPQHKTLGDVACQLQRYRRNQQRWWSIDEDVAQPGQRAARQLR
jgi:hypothetical protein